MNANPLATSVQLTLPAWLVAAQAELTASTYPDDADKMRLAIALSARNIDEQSGGPFGAAIFDAQHRLIATGVNRVLPVHTSIAHAEMMAFALAQQHIGHAKLSTGGEGFVMATSSQPCCMCYGATFWSGIERLLIGARSDDVESLTEFNEGPLPNDWQGELNKRGIRVTRDIMRDQACDVLRAYTQQHGAMY